MLEMSKRNPLASVCTKRERGFSLKGKEESRINDRARSWTAEVIFSVLRCQESKGISNMKSTEKLLEKRCNNMLKNILPVLQYSDTDDRRS